MSTTEYVRTGWACVTDTLCGPYVSLEGSTADDSEPVIFDTRAEAEAERAQYIDMMLEAREHDIDAEPGELAELMELERRVSSPKSRSRSSASTRPARCSSST